MALLDKLDKEHTIAGGDSMVAGVSGVSSAGVIAAAPVAAGGALVTLHKAIVLFK